MAEAAASPGAAPLLSARGLCKRYRNGGTAVTVLEDLDIDLAAGETVAVVGASGIGKSTLLHVLGTLERPDRGRLRFRGEDVLAFPADRLARFRNETIGFVFQFHHLLAEFTALENAMMPALIQGLSRQEAAAAAEAVLVRVGLGGRLSFRVNRLSGGEQQRVAIARALVLRPPILLADEPTGNLDRTNGEAVHRLLLELNAELGMTLVVVTHNLELAARLSRRVTLRDGRLAA
ncbi:MAG: ABC transporter ATP-binding protein, partial [Desulfobacterales bacterium]